MKQVRGKLVDSINAKRIFSFGGKTDDDNLSKNFSKQKNEKIEPKSAVYKAEKKKFKFLEFKKQKKFSVQGLIVIALLLPLFIFAIVSIGYQFHNEGKIYSGVNVFGIDAGGKTKDEVSKLIDSKISNYKLKIEGENQEFDVTYADLGINYDKDKILTQAYLYGRDDSVLNNFFNRAKRFMSQYEFSLGSNKFSFKKYNINLIYTVSDDKLNKFLSDLEEKININAKDSEITTSGSSMQIVPAVFGRKVRTAELKDQILKASVSFESTPLKIQTDVTNPTILDDKTKALAEQADRITSKSIVLTYKDKKYQPSKETVVSWVTFTRPNNQADWQMFIDQNKMYGYFEVIGKDINVYSTPQKIRVENETKEIVTQQGVNGLIINQASLAQQIATQLQSSPSVSLEIPMMTDNFKTEKDFVVVANWDKYIDVNISSQHMDAYLKGGQKVGSWAVTTGRNGWNTPTGTFLIQRKAYNVCMPNPPSTQPLCDIHYVSYFTSAGHAIHQAWWRSSFGGMDYVWNGSHGCINAPLSVAQFIYDWADIGTPVVIHY